MKGVQNNQKRKSDKEKIIPLWALSQYINVFTLIVLCENGIFT